MTIDVEISEERFTGIVDGVPVTCNFPCNDEVTVVVRYGEDVTAILNTDYTVTLAAPDYETFQVTPLAGFAATSGGTISVARELALTQDVNLATTEDVASGNFTRALDKLTMLVQQLKTKSDRAIYFPFSDDESERGNLPVAADRASALAGYDANGVPSVVQIVDVSESGVVFSVFGTDWAGLADAASALTTLGFTTVGTFGKTLVAAVDQAAAKTLLDCLMADDNITFSGDNDYTGVNDFTAGTIVVDTPTVDGEATNKGYVDDAIDTALGGVGVVVNQSTDGPTIQNLTATGTYTTGVDSNAEIAKWIKVRIYGSGGGGGGFDGVSVQSGAAGANTSFNGIVAAGGSGGSSAVVPAAAPGGAGGTGGAGAANFRRPGHRGGIGFGDATTSHGGVGAGHGGGSPGVLTGGSANGGAGVANSGGGGGGAAADTVYAAGGGGEGEYVELIILNPDATYAVVIGAGGAGGNSTGGAGGSGRVVVEEHYNY